MAKKSKDLSVFVALDRSGSMGGEKWTNAVDSLNEYVKGLQKEKIKGDITIVAFDSDGMYGGASSVRLHSLAESADIANFASIHPSVLHPAGGTPLYDAAGHVINLALEKNSKRTVIVILTDGEENTSKEYTQAKIKEKVTEVTAKGWEVIFLGANFDAAKYNAGSGLAAGKLRNFDLNDLSSRTAMYSDLTKSTTAYATTGAAMNLNVAVEINKKV